MAARHDIPALLLIRNPEGAILSELLYDNVELADALDAYARYYTRLLPYLDSFVLGEFKQVTHSFGAVVSLVNARFGTSFAEFKHSDEAVRECFELMNFRSTRSEAVYGFESGLVSPDELRRRLPALKRESQPPQFRQAYVPSEDRARQRPALLERWLDPRLSRRRERAQSVYREVLAATALEPTESQG